MTLFHFLNCAALSVGPHLILQHLEQAAVSRQALLGSIAFFITQLFRIIILVPLLQQPSSSSSSALVARLCDLIGLGLVILVLRPRNPRPLAIFWALMDSVTTNCFKQYRLIGAYEFDPEALVSAVLASPHLFATLAVAIALASFRREASGSLNGLVTLVASAVVFVATPLFQAQRTALPGMLLAASLSTLVPLALLSVTVLVARRAEICKKRA